MVSLFSLLGLGRAWKFLSRGGGDVGETSLNLEIPYEIYLTWKAYLTAAEALCDIPRRRQ